MQYINISPQKQLGFSLLESLIAILVMALGILGILGMQVRTLINTQNSLYRTQAIRLIEDLSERLMLHPNSLNTYEFYLSSNNDKNIKDCIKKPCTSTEIAQRDSVIWKNSVANTLPAGQANVFLAEDEINIKNHRQLGVMIAWRENEAYDSIEYKNPLNNINGSGQQECPDGFICHMQFITLKARCAPYSASGTKKFYCQENLAQ